MPNRHGQDDEYRYGFQGQEMDDEIRNGKGNSVNYKYRMHDARIGRFFAVDPLSYKYPFYSPYAFSGNRVIDAVELEGLEPETVIKSNYLTSSVRQFMKPALNVSMASLNNVKWYSLKEYQADSKGHPINYVIAEQALKTHGLITVHSELVVFRDEYKKNSTSSFLSDIAHEHTHVSQYLKYGYLGFITKYGLQVKKYGYRMAPMEVLAYNIGDAMENWLLSNEYVIDLINTERAPLNCEDEQQLNNNLEKAGKLFRYEKGIDVEINFWTESAAGLLKQIEENGATLETAPEPLKQTYNAYRQQITTLQLEKENLKKDLNIKDEN